MAQTITPTEITRCVDTETQIASFDYYDGIAYAKKNKLKQAVKINDLYKGTHYIVCCGNVMINVTPQDYPEIIRKNI